MYSPAAADTARDPGHVPKRRSDESKPTSALLCVTFRVGLPDALLWLWPEQTGKGVHEGRY
ncbi:MAG: hypothetical protein AAGF31_08480, partial [Planctomycetota bacterium]